MVKEKIALDTNVVIDILNNKQNIVTFSKWLSNHLLACNGMRRAAIWREKLG